MSEMPGQNAPDAVSGPTTHPSASMVIARRIKQEIVTGQLAPGTRLPEITLGRRFEVSRVPVREALKLLESEGLVESKPYSGSSVSQLPTDDARDLFDVRIVIEGAAARRAAERSLVQAQQSLPDENWWAARKEITAVLRSGDQALSEDRLEDLARLNMRFHLLVTELSGSQSLWNLLQQISGKIEWLYSLNVNIRGSRAWPEHHEIMAAVDAGRGDAAAMIMQRHVTRSRDSYFDMFRQ